MSPGSSTESYPAFAHIGLRENPGKNLNQCDRWERDPGCRVDVETSPSETPADLLCAEPYVVERLPSFLTPQEIPMRSAFSQ
ncbi:hypothetical protein ANN_08335 [Periplaneta americana]|uniref:Uncharacterized protein n=1 Tax=Periplaneta americana TaxID=6978 RepID=A0ABQ8T2N3_PERAM|nr:hypothetical protein ANN_08335 [Periplaneta americana]